MSPFIAGLRALVGNSLLQLPTVAVLCRDEAGNVLLVLERDSHLWSIPGGAIEPGESPLEAAEREVLEETGLTIEIVALRTVLGGPEFRIVYSNGDQLSYVAIVYDAVVVRGLPHADGEETLDARFVARDELGELATDAFVKLVLEGGLLE